MTREHINHENTEKPESHVNLGKSFGDNEYVQQKGHVFFIFIQFCKHCKEKNELKVYKTSLNLNWNFKKRIIFFFQSILFTFQ